MHNELVKAQRRGVTCVYCGKEYADGTPASRDERLYLHIRECPEHPMAQVISAARNLLKFGPPREGSAAYHNAWNELGELVGE